MFWGFGKGAQWSSRRAIAREHDGMISPNAIGWNINVAIDRSFLKEEDFAPSNGAIGWPHPLMDEASTLR